MNLTCQTNNWLEIVDARSSFENLKTSNLICGIAVQSLVQYPTEVTTVRNAMSLIATLAHLPTRDKVRMGFFPLNSLHGKDINLFFCCICVKKLRDLGYIPAMIEVLFKHPVNLALFQTFCEAVHSQDSPSGLGAQIRRELIDVEGRGMMSTFGLSCVALRSFMLQVGGK